MPPERRELDKTDVLFAADFLERYLRPRARVDIRFFCLAFLTAATLGGGACSSGPSEDQTGRVPDEGSPQALRHAARLKPRVIFNDDSEPLHHPKGRTPEGFLDARIRPLAGTHVTTIGWSVLAGDAPCYDSRVQPIFGDAQTDASQLNRNHIANLDRLAREGMRFDRCLVTNSICAPSRAVILTGKYSHVNGVLDNLIVFEGSQETFPKLLQQRGYQTAVVGKWHLKSDPTGFDHWMILPDQGSYYNPELLSAEGSVQIEGYVTDVITDLVLDWLKERRDPDRPFLLMYQHKAPHRNWMPGPQHLNRFISEAIPEPETLFDDYSRRASPAANQSMEIGRHMLLSYDLKLAPGEGVSIGEREIASWKHSFGRLTKPQREAWNAAYAASNRAFRETEMTGRDLVRWKYQRYIKDYLRCVASIDDNLGRVLDYLDRAGLTDDTVVVYSSDQGFFLGEHGWFDKRWMYEESLRTPLIVRWPGVVAAGSSDSSLVSNLDLAETFLEMAGVPVPGEMQGLSLVPLLGGEVSSDWRESFYYHYYESMLAHGVPEHYGLATDRYKLIHYPETLEWELFDRQSDPSELVSLYDSPDHLEVQDELRKELENLRQKLGVTASTAMP